MKKFLFVVSATFMALSSSANAGLITDQHVVYTMGGFSGGHVHAGDPGLISTNGGEDLFSEISALSAYYGAMEENGTKNELFGTLTLSGNSDLNVFNLDASEFIDLYNLYIDIGDKDKAIINVTGTDVVIKTNISDIIHLKTEDLADRLLFNFVDAQSIYIQGSFFGTALAPYADVSGEGGNWKGGLFAKSYTGKYDTHQFYLYSFDFELPPPPPSSDVPESSTTTMLVAGAIFVLFLSRKNAFARK